MKTELIALRMTAEERQALAQLAQAHRGNGSEALREALRESAQKRGCWPPPKVKPYTGGRPEPLKP